MMARGVKEKKTFYEYVKDESYQHKTRRNGRDRSLAMKHIKPTSRRVIRMTKKALFGRKGTWNSTRSLQMTVKTNL